ncbi:MAG: hypothetical protein VX015_15435 [Planctomycetota bacterium]|nr:hypothetical protein [Planctomycetota bacterium]
MSNLDETLRELERCLHERERLTHRLRSATQRLELERRRRAQLGDALRKEEADVERLEGLTLTALFHTVLTTRTSQLEKERQEALKARLAYDTSSAAIESAEAEVDGLTRALEPFADLEERVGNARKAREEALRDVNGARGQELVRIAERRAALAGHANRIRDAQRCGIAAYESLETLEKELTGAAAASNWDRFGGGAVPTAIKHSKMDRARDLVDQVEEDLHRFEDELDAIDEVEGITLELEMPASLRFADLFFDCLIIDWNVHGKIKRSLDHTREAMALVRETVEHLDSDVTALVAQSEALEAQRRTILRG